VGVLLLGFVLGFAASSAAAILLIAAKRVDLDFEARDGVPDPRGWKFVHIYVTNRRSPWWGRFRDETAFLATAELEFREDVDGENLFRPISARWPRFQPQPLGSNPSINEIIIPYRETLPPGDHAMLNVAIKHQGDRQAYAFNNESYLYLGAGWRHPKRRLDAVRIYVRATVYVSGKPHPSEWFVLTNPDAMLANFKLGPEHG
jgi:hypothetical protein